MDDENSLLIISNFVNKDIIKENINGLCYGSRNSFEQEFFNSNIKNIKIISPDICETANDFKTLLYEIFMRLKMIC